MEIFPSILVVPALSVPLMSIVVWPMILELPEIVPEVITGEIKVLLVKLSVVLRPTKVSVLVGRLSVPTLVIVLITGLVMVLLFKVSVASRVATIPSAGNVAVELIPIPPRVRGSMPVVAGSWERSIELKAGALPSLGIVRL